MHLTTTQVEETMLRITTEQKRGRTVLSVEGRLSGPTIATLSQCWRELRSASPEEKFHVNLCGVSFIDGAGKMLLKEIHSQGGQLIAEGCLNQAIVKEIVGEGKAANETKRCKGPNFFFYVALFSLLLGARTAGAQNAPSAEPLKLTLEQAVSLAVKQNPTAQIAVLQAAQAQQDKNISFSKLLPEASLSVQET